MLAGAGALVFWPSAGDATEHDRHLYLDNCAAFHRTDLEANPTGVGRLPAPPHDASGHTWPLPDRMLREIILRGTAPVVGDGYESDMPSFADLLTEAEIEAILDYLRPEWPERAHLERVTAADEAAGG